MATTLDSRLFRDTMGAFASGVTVVTTGDSGGQFVGFTASSFCSLSLNPPLLLVCLQNDADCFAAFMEAPQIAVSILAHGQEDVARRFATKAIDKMNGTSASAGPITGLPLIEGASAWAECTVRDRFDGGDHTILVAEVIGAEANEVPPLLRHSRHFGRFEGEGPIQP
jgi:flavin reductase ActVB